MKRKSRELNIFSMSALDLFASALGAFILITLILMPYYLKESPPPQESPECPECPEISECPEPCTPCPDPEVIRVSVVKDNLILLQMFWDKKVDIDMHVKTPDGTFYYNKETISGRPGQFFQDDTKGGTAADPAKEGWLSFKPTPGTYEICYNYFTSPFKGNVQVWGKMQKPSGPVDLARVTLRRSKEMKCATKFRITHDAQVEIIN